MLWSFRSTKNQKEKLTLAAHTAPLCDLNLLTIDGLLRTPPKGFAHDFSRSELGRGLNLFVSAREAFEEWIQFDLGWVMPLKPSAKIALGEVIGIEVHILCLWLVNFNRIVEIVNSPTRFGFMYSTTALHVEEGQERFVIEFDCKNESVSYLIEAVSRPRHLLARIGYLVARAMQHRFTKDSHARIKRYIKDH